MTEGIGQEERAILDTSIVIAENVAAIPGVLAISAVTLAELQFGVLVARARRFAPRVEPRPVTRTARTVAATVLASVALAADAAVVAAPASAAHLPRHHDPRRARRSSSRHPP